MSPLGRGTKPIARNRKSPRTRRCIGCNGRYVGLKCPMCATRSTTARGSVGKRCDKLWADYVKRDGRCFICGTTEGIQAAHIVGRAQRVVRWSVAPLNGIPMCHQHHRMFDTYKLDREAVITSYLGVTEYLALRQKALGVWDKQYPLAELTAALKAAKEKAA